MIRIASVLSAALVSLVALSASADWAKVADSDLVKTADQWTIRHDFTTATDSTPYNVSACNGLVEAKFDPSVYDSSTNAGVEIRACRGSSDTTGRCRMVSSSTQTSMSDWTAINSLVEGEGYLLAHPIAATSGGDTARIEIRCTESEALQAGAADGGSHDACRSGTVQGGGLGADGRWAWTCGNFPWREWQDPAVANAASYTVECTGDGTPHTSCIRAGEVRHVGFGLNVALAVQYTKDGGTVFLPRGLYVDNGAGLNAAGEPTGFPRPYDPRWESRSDYDLVGYPYALRVIQINRGVRVVGEGVPRKYENDPNDSTVSANRPKLKGTWIVDDRNAADASPIAATLEGIDQTIDPTDYYRITVGGNPYRNYCETTSNTDAHCVVDNASDAPEQSQDMQATGRVWGIEFSTNQNISQTSMYVCFPDTDWTGLGTTVADAKGTCSLNRMIPCWDQSGAADVARSSGGCDFGAGGDFGVCEAPYEAIVTDYVTNSKDLQLVLGLNECPDIASSSTDCNNAVGVDFYVHDFRTPPGTAFTVIGDCNAGSGSTSGTYVQLGNARQAAGQDFSAGMPFPTFYTGSNFNRIFPIERGSFDGQGAGFESIGRMPAQWLTRDSVTAAADCLSAGSISDSNDEPQCDTDTLSGFAASYNNVIGPNNLYYKASQYFGKSAIVETYPAGGPNTFIGNVVDTHYRATVTDWGTGLMKGNVFRNLNASGYSGNYALFACFNGYCDFEANLIEQSSFSVGLIAENAAQMVRMKDNLWSNVGVTDSVYNIRGPRKVEIDGDRFSGTSYYGPLARILPGTTSVQKPDVTIKNIDATFQISPVASGTTTGAGTPSTLVLVEGSDAEDLREDDYKRLLIDNLHLRVVGTNDPCLVWFEDDWDNINAGTGGTADAASLNREAASRATIRNSSITAGGAPAVACTGQYDFQASVYNAATSGVTNWAVEAYAPRLVGNQVNNAPIPDMLPTISEASVPLASALPDGTEVRLHDVAAACGHTTGNLNSGANVLTCVSDQATNTWALK